MVCVNIAILARKTSDLQTLPPTTLINPITWIVDVFVNLISYTSMYKGGKGRKQDEEITQDNKRSGIFREIKGNQEATTKTGFHAWFLSMHASKRSS